MSQRVFTMTSLIGIALVGLLSGVVIGWLLRTKSATGAGFAALGATAGLMIGLSVSPVVATAVTTILGLLTVLVPVYFQDQANRQAAAQATAGQPNPTPPSLPPLGLWLFPFAGMLLVGVLAGVAIRVNDALNFAPAPNPSFPERYQAMGFTKDQIKAIMDGHARAYATGRGPGDEKPKDPGSVLHNLIRPVGWDAIWKGSVRGSDTAKVNLERLKSNVDGTPIAAAIEQLKLEGNTPESILSELDKKFKAP